MPRLTSRTPIKKKGQSALEFVILASLMLVGVATMIIAAQRVLIDVSVEQNQKVVSAIYEAITREIRLADIQLEGYTRSFTLPETFDGVPYTITVLDESPPLFDAIRVNWKQESFMFFVEQNINGTLSPGANTIRRNATTVILN